MRVHELAKELKISSKELLERLHARGLDAKSHMSTLDDNMVASFKKTEKQVRLAPPRKEESRKEEFKKDVGLSVPPIVEKVKEAAGPSVAVAVEPVRIDFPISVGALAEKLKIRVAELIKSLINIGVFANVNQLLGEEVVFKVASQLSIPVERAAEKDEKKQREVKAGQTAEKGQPRFPVVTLMGHVDHGKTSLLDAIRKTNVVSREAGRITQHIGAYVVELPGKGHVTFLDTPGHEAFTAMRARGANVTDVVVLVVAADDGVMPQTIEAIDHAREAGAPIVVAVNKCDLPQANPQRVMMQLQKIGLVPEEWGGKAIFCKISAKTGEGIDSLLEMLLLESEILELRANRDCLAQGTVIESRLTKGSGPVATVVIQEGTLRVGEVVIAGPYYGKVRMLQNDRRKNIREAGPSYAVEVHGLNGVPEAGEIFRAVEDEKTARGIAEKRQLEIREKGKRGAVRHLSLEDLHERIKAGAVKELKLIIKADVQGSVEALTQSLERLSGEAVRLRVIHGGVGSPNESDVMLAAASDAIVLGFHVRPEPRAQQVSQEEGIDIRFYNIIYEAVEDVRKAMEGLLEPIYQEVVEGRAEVRRVFRSSKSGTVGGAMVSKGKISRSSRVRLLRKQTVVFDGKLASLKRFKDDVREIAEGYEFGFVLDNFSDLQEGDALEAFRLEKVAGQKLK